LPSPSSAADAAKHFIGLPQPDAAHKVAQRQRRDAAHEDAQRSEPEPGTMAAAEPSAQCVTDTSRDRYSFLPGDSANAVSQTAYIHAVRLGSALLVSFSAGPTY